MQVKINSPNITNIFKSTLSILFIMFSQMSSNYFRALISPSLSDRLVKPGHLHILLGWDLDPFFCSLLLRHFVSCFLIFDFSKTIFEYLVFILPSFLSFSSFTFLWLYVFWIQWKTELVLQHDFPLIATTFSFSGL